MINNIIVHRQNQRVQPLIPVHQNGHNLKSTDTVYHLYMQATEGYSQTSTMWYTVDDLKWNRSTGGSVIFLLTKLCMAAPIMGVDIKLPGRGDLAWAEQGEATQHLLSEDDGWLKGPIHPWFGWDFTEGRLNGSLDFAWSQKNSVIEDQTYHVHVGALRIAMDGYKKFGSSAGTKAFVGFGIFGTVPFAEISSETYTTEEEESFEEITRQTKDEISSVGARVSLGSEWKSDSPLSIGTRLSLSGRLKNQQSEDFGSEVNFQVESEAVVTLGWHF